MTLESTVTCSDHNHSAVQQIDIRPTTSDRRAKKQYYADVDNFLSYFDIKLATTEELLNAVYRIRGDVYCKEFKYESEEDCPNGLEQDEFDETQSAHCLITHRESQLPAGCVRLVMTDRQRLSSLLPIEKYCADSLRHPTFHPQKLPRASLAEVSRLAVHTHFRRRQGEQVVPAGITSLTPFAESERRTFPLISVALMLAATSFAVLMKRQHNFCMMEPRLMRLAQGLGIEWQRIGDVIDYHGRRAAYYITADKAVTGIKGGDLRKFYGSIYDLLQAEQK